MAAGSFASASIFKGCLDGASSAISLVILIVGGRRALKERFFLPGVPMGRAVSGGRGEAAQFSAISPEAVGQIRYSEEEYPSGLVGQGSWSLYLARSTRSPAAFCNSIWPPPCLSGFLSGPREGRR